MSHTHVKEESKQTEKTLIKATQKNKKQKDKIKRTVFREGKYLLHAPLFYGLLPPCRVISPSPCPHQHYIRKLRNQNPACRWERGENNMHIINSVRKNDREDQPKNGKSNKIKTLELYLAAILLHITLLLLLQTSLLLFICPCAMQASRRATIKPKA